MSTIGSYVCSRCAAECSEFLTTCPACGSWWPFRPKVLVPLRTVVGGVHPVPLSKLLPAQRTYPVWGLGALPAGDPAVVLVSGPPGGGKSTYALRVADSIAPRRGVLYIAAEEGLGETFRARVRDLEVTTDRVLAAPACFQPDALAQLEEHACTWLFLDSWSVLRWTVQELMAVKERGFSVLFIVHATKGDDPAGPLALEHLADASVWVEDLIYTHRKNRFGVLETGRVRELREEPLSA